MHAVMALLSTNHSPQDAYHLSQEIAPEASKRGHQRRVPCLTARTPADILIKYQAGVAQW